MYQVDDAVSHKVKLYTGNKSCLDLAREKVAELGLQRDEAFFLADLGDLFQKYGNWKRLLPRVEPFYAVKCNPDRTVLKFLADLGIGFDCASKDELERVLGLGVHPSRIVYAHPVKQISFLRYAAERKVTDMTFDSEEELHKIKNIFPKARLILRILPPENFNVAFKLGNKYGCHPRDVPRLLSKTEELGLTVIGISFHVGSGLKEAGAFRAAMETAAGVFREATDRGFNLTLLDIGGGFPGQEDWPGVTFEELASEVNESLDRLFPRCSNIRVIAEPGTYFVASAFSLCTNVIGKRAPSSRVCKVNGNSETPFMYYTNDGVYGSFNILLVDSTTPKMKVIPLTQATSNGVKHRSVVFGPTCDGKDIVFQDIDLPELNVGDYLLFPNQGDYTFCLATTFNGVPLPLRFFCCQREIWNQVYPPHGEDLEETDPDGGCSTV